jgi:hypothetical protein
VGRGKLLRLLGATTPLAHEVPDRVVHLEVAGDRVVIQSLSLPPLPVEVPPSSLRDEAAVVGILEGTGRHRVRVENPNRALVLKDAVALLHEQNQSIVGLVRNVVGDVLYEMAREQLVNRVTLEGPRKLKEVDLLYPLDLLYVYAVVALLASLPAG